MFAKLLLPVVLLTGPLHAQERGTDHVAAWMKSLTEATMDAERDSISDLIITALQDALQAPDGPSRSFEGVPVSRIDAPDGAFRLLTWNIPRTDGSHRFHGLLLAQNGKGHLVHRLLDRTDEIPSPEVPELGADRWYGAIYYQVVPIRKGAKTYYTLLGWKGHSPVETRKVIEVLHFKGGQPRFGAPLFGAGRLKATRKVYGYSFQASMTLRWDTTAERIVLDHLSPARADLEGQWAFYGPDLSYDAFVWSRDHWAFERDVDVRDLGRDRRPFNAPPPAPGP